MIIVTARIPRKRLLAGCLTALCCCAVVVTALVLTLSSRSVTAAAEIRGIGSNEDRIAYLNQLGWQVTEAPIATEELLIPKTFDDSYADYLALQSGQGFDLTQYCGKRVKRYTYEITNYPTGESNVQAALLIYKNRIIGGQIQSSTGSFIHSLAMPQADSANTAQPSASQSSAPQSSLPVSPVPSAAA